MLSFERRLGGLEGESHRSDLDVLYLHWPQAQKSKFIYSYNVCALQDRANGLLTAKVIRKVVVIAFTSRLGCTVALASDSQLSATASIVVGW